MSTHRAKTTQHNPLRVLIVAAGFFLLFQMLMGCDYARMKEDEALRTYETELPVMPRNAIPVTGGVAQVRDANPEELQNPLTNTQQVVQRGQESYRAYCIQCHGPKVDGRGTVGQSFAPLPTNLKEWYVQEQSDGELFYKISFGFERHPPLADTVPEEERWAIIHYIRSLATPT